MNFILLQNTPPRYLPKSCYTDQHGNVQNTPNSKNWCTKNFKVLIWGHLEAIPNFTSQNHEFHFFTKYPTKPSTRVVPHRPTWPCAKHIELKTLAHQEFYITHFGHLEAIPTFTSQKPWISFFHKTPHPGIYLSRATPINFAIFKTHRTQKIGAPRILRYSFGDTWRPFQTLHLKNHEFHFFTKHPTKPST